MPAHHQSDAERQSRRQILQKLKPLATLAKRAFKLNVESPERTYEWHVRGIRPLIVRIQDAEQLISDHLQEYPERTLKQSQASAILYRLGGVYNPSPLLRRIRQALSFHEMYGPDLPRLLKALQKQCKQLANCWQERGRPPRTKHERKEDERVYNAWKSGEHRTFAELAQQLNCSKDSVRKAVERHAKWLRRNREINFH